jgi:metal-responsive CopG/Arc/MetJ family transcriptional regulator
MKAVVTSFSMSLSQAQRIGEHLRGVKNRSAWIVDAIQKKIKEEASFDEWDIPYRSLLIVLKNNKETPEHLKVLLQAELNKV